MRRELEHKVRSPRTARRTSRIAALTLLLAALLAGWTARASAQTAPPLDVAQLSPSEPLRAHLTAYLDAEDRLTVDQLRAAPPAPTPLPSDLELSFGVRRTPLWLVFDVVNTGSRPQPFLLELDYPLLDHVTMVVAYPDGHREQRVTGDEVPFAQRDVDMTPFVFRFEAAPGERASYYLRVQTSGVLKAPLFAWSPEAFFNHQRQHDLILWTFYGVLLVLVLYNFGVYALTRLPEHFAHGGMLIALTGVISSLNGHIFEYLLPNHPGVANRALPLFLTLVIASAARLAQHIVADIPSLRRDHRILGYWFPVNAALALVCCMLEPGLALRVMFGAVAVGLVHSMVELFRLVGTHHPESRIYLLSWIPLLLALPLQLLRNANLLPESPLTDFSAHVAIGLHGLTTSLALASRVNAMRAGLHDLNQQLSSNVTALEVALARAEQASEQARRATLAKDEFVATMSHELRTPLNAIINVPQGLLDDFVKQPVARCSVCGTQFLLDPGERIEPDLPCAECGGVDTLQPVAETRYQGDPDRTVHFLQRIERSGRHLLQMINGVLDFSKIEAGHLTLEPMLIDLGLLLRDVAEEMADLASKKQQRIELIVTPSSLPTVADPTRVKQIMINLLGNAVKFSEPGTVIVVQWHALPEADQVSVQDHGIGIAEADQERVFQRFEQVHTGDTRKYGGTGLGLPISRSLARMHGGDLTVHSRLGEGATFTLSLPRRTAKRRASLRNSDAA